MIKFYLTNRKNKKALWVKEADAMSYNIWDLTQEECTPDVLDAVKSAFERGVEFANAHSKGYSCETKGKDWVTKRKLSS